MKKVLMTGMIATAVFAMSSCSKDNPAPGLDLNKVKTAKFTITVNGANASEVDYVSLTLSSGTATGGSTIWKVNGVEQINEAAININEDDFAGATKTYVIELTKAVPAISGSLQIINFDAPISFSYKAEINGEVVKNIVNQEVPDGDDFTEQYTY